MAMKTAPKRKLVSMDAPSREAVRKGNDNDAAGKTGLLEMVLIPKLWTSALMISA